MDKNGVIYDTFDPRKKVVVYPPEDYSRYAGPSFAQNRVCLVIIAPQFAERNKATGLSKMLSTFKSNLAAFCNEHPNVHSAWINVGHNHKNITVFTITDNWDFDLEGEIFDGPYSELPSVTSDGYYIEQRVSFLNDDNIEDILPSGYMPIFERDN